MSKTKMTYLYQFYWCKKNAHAFSKLYDWYPIKIYNEVINIKN